MKLYRLIGLRLKTYFKNLSFILTLGLFLVILWGILNFTQDKKKNVFTLPITIIDLDQTSYSNLIIDRVAKKSTISIKNLSIEESFKQVSTGKLEAIYILQEGFMDQILKGNINEIIEIVKSPVSLSAEIIGELFSAEVMRLSSNVSAANDVARKYQAADKDSLWKEAWELTDANWEPTPLITIDYHSTNQNLPKEGINTEIIQIKKNTSQILILTLLMFSILIATSSLLNEKNNGTLKRIKTSSTSLIIYILSVILSIVILHALGLLSITLLARPAPIQLTDFLRHFVLYIIYMFWAAGLGVTIVLFSKKMQHLLIIIPMIALLNGLLLWNIF